MDLNKLFHLEIKEHEDVLEATKNSIFNSFSELVLASINSINNGGKILFFGNGGSAADAQHLATELVVRYKNDRKPIAAVALTTDSSAITAGGNDLGFDNIFSRQISAITKPGDVAIGISTSGNSQNVINGLIEAKLVGAIPAGFGGKGGGRMIATADPYLIVPSSNTARIQEMHIIIGHMFCNALEQKLNLL